MTDETGTGQVTCAACGAANDAGMGFCGRCGAALTPAAADEAGADPASPASPAVAAPTGWDLVASGMGQAPVSPLGQYGPIHKEECAGWGARFGASLLDQLIIYAIYIVLFLIGWALLAGLAPDYYDALSQWMNSDYYYEQDLPSQYEAPTAALFIVGILLAIAISVLWEVLWTRSEGRAKPGQRAAGFRVVRTDDLSRIGVGRAIGRWAAKIIYQLSYLGLIPYIATAFTIGLQEKRQSLHDMMCGTVCLRKDALARRGIGIDAQNPQLVHEGRRYDGLQNPFGYPPTVPLASYPTAGPGPATPPAPPAPGAPHVAPPAYTPPPAPPAPPSYAPPSSPVPPPPPPLPGQGTPQPPTDPPQGGPFV